MESDARESPSGEINRGKTTIGFAIKRPERMRCIVWRLACFGAEKKKNVAKFQTKWIFLQFTYNSVESEVDDKLARGKSTIVRGVGAKRAKENENSSEKLNDKMCVFCRMTKHLVRR